MPFRCHREPERTASRRDACLICLAGLAARSSPRLLHFVPSGLGLLGYWLIFHFASVVTPDLEMKSSAAPKPDDGGQSLDAWKSGKGFSRAEAHGREGSFRLG